MSTTSFQLSSFYKKILWVENGLKLVHPYFKKTALVAVVLVLPVGILPGQPPSLFVQICTIWQNYSKNCLATGNWDSWTLLDLGDIDMDWFRVSAIYSKNLAWNASNLCMKRCWSTLWSQGLIKCMFRQKEMRKLAIKNHIEDSFNWKGKTMPNGEQVKEKVNQFPDLIFPISTTVAPSPVSIDYTQRVQSFFPECNYRHKTRLILQAPEDPNIDIHLFKIKFPTARAGSKLSINEAQLRLYKLGVANPTSNPNCPPENKIRITVSWLKLKNSGIRPAEQVMLDSVMVDGSIAGWTQLDVTGAVRSWYKHRHM